MGRKRHVWLLAIALLAIVVGGCDWQEFGLNYQNTKFNPEFFGSILKSSNVSTLHQSWAATLHAGGTSTSTPATATIDGTDWIFVVTADGWLEKRNVTNGASAAGFPINVHSPAGVSGGHLFPTSSPLVGQIPGTQIVQVVVGAADGGLYAIDARTGAVRWVHNGGGAPVWTSPVQTPNNTIAAVQGSINTQTGAVDYTLYTLDINSGGVIGTASVGRASGVNPTLAPSSPAFDGNGTAYVGTPGPDPFGLGSGHVGVLAIAHADTGVNESRMWFHDTNGDENDFHSVGFLGVPSTPVVNNGLVLSQSVVGLLALNPSNGAIVWSRPAMSAIFNSPTIDNDSEIVAVNDNYAGNVCMCAYNVNNGAQLWFRNPVVAGGAGSMPSSTNDLFMATFNGDAQVKIWSENGSGDTAPIKVLNASADAVVPPVIANGKIITVGNGTLRVFVP